ncbi:MAG: hypothetical protein SF162_08835 [bacterium]|nr:hypothetical protein [bacterium]
MVLTPLDRDRLLATVEKLSPEQFSAFMRLLETIVPDEAVYDPAQDRLVGFFDGDPDLASNTNAILKRE